MVAWVSDALPNIASIADELCFIKSMHTEQFNHAPAELLLFTGSPQFGRPGMGSWVTYGLGSENQNLPGFIVLVSSGTFAGRSTSIPSGGGFACRTRNGIEGIDKTRTPDVGPGVNWPDLPGAAAKP